MDVRKLLRHELDQAIGMVPQKAFLFSGTLEDNLRDGKPDATQEELWEALSIAQAKEFVEKNERGLKMKVSEGGNKLFGRAAAAACNRKSNCPQTLHLFV